jgi:hypothetical protein
MAGDEIDVAGKVAGTVDRHERFPIGKDLDLAVETMSGRFVPPGSNRISPASNGRSLPSGAIRSICVAVTVGKMSFSGAPGGGPSALTSRIQPRKDSLCNRFTVGEPRDFAMPGT